MEVLKMALKKKSDDLGFQDTIDEIEEEGYRQLDPNSPITSEDGYVHGEPMLYGYKDKETGILHNTFTYREMDGRDEEAIQKAEVRSNGAKLTNTLVERCVLEIGDFSKKEMGSKKWGDFIRNLNSGELDYMMLKIREISKGSEITFSHKCPRCGTKLDTVMEISDFKCTEFGGEEEIPFELIRGYKDKNGVIHKKGFIRLTNGYDREIITPLMMKNKANAITTLITRVVTFDDGTPVFSDNVKAMSVRDRSYLEKLINDSTYGIDMSFDDVHCPSCDADLSEERYTSDFF